MTDEREMSEDEREWRARMEFERLARYDEAMRQAQAQADRAEANRMRAAWAAMAPIAAEHGFDLVVVTEPHGRDVRLCHDMARLRPAAGP